MTPEPRLTLLGRFAACAGLLCLAYWGLFALVSPAMNIDGQMYDVARIELAWRAGLFSNPLFTSPYQLMWPWGFDATELPFVLAGWGYVIPSFLCLLGLFVIARRMVSERFGPDAGWMAGLALLGLTCLVYQGTTTKNDIPIAFGGAVWLYARSRWRATREGVHLLWMAVAIGFMAGSKTTGVIFGAILAIWMLIEGARKDRGLALQILGLLTVSVALQGSVETYVETYRTFGTPLGPPALVASLRAEPGIPAYAKNLIHFLRGSVWDLPLPAALRWDDFERPAASAWWHGLPIRSWQCEEFTGYGIVGLIALGIMILSLLTWRRRSVWWQLSAAGLGCVAVVAACAQHSVNANRYLLPAFSLAAVGCVAALWEWSAPVACRWMLAAIIATSAVAAPLVSFNRTPSDLLRCLTARRDMEACVYPVGLAARRSLEEIEAKEPGRPIAYVVGIDSHVLPYLEDEKLPLRMVTPPTFLRMLDDHTLKPGDLVLEDLHVATDRLQAIECVTTPLPYFPSQTISLTIYRVKQAPH